ncbi:hypothetical protein AVEN_82287-1, partial [Araneus ventricosus]
LYIFNMPFYHPSSFLLVSVAADSRKVWKSGIQCVEIHIPLPTDILQDRSIRYLTARNEE